VFDILATDFRNEPIHSDLTLRAWQDGSTFLLIAGPEENITRAAVYVRTDHSQDPALGAMNRLTAMVLGVAYPGRFDENARKELTDWITTTLDELRKVGDGSRTKSVKEFRVTVTVSASGLLFTLQHGSAPDRQKATLDQLSKLDR
jgi:hypothetical protein